MRLLLASTGLHGHLDPLLPFAAAARGAGHECLLVLPEAGRQRAEAAGIPHLVGADPPEDQVTRIWAAFATASPIRRARLVDGELFPQLQADAMGPAMDHAFRTWRPDLVLRDPCEYASAAAALAHGVPHATVAISRGGVEASALRAGIARLLSEPHFAAAARAVADEMRQQPTAEVRLRALWDGRHGEDPGASPKRRPLRRTVEERRSPGTLRPLGHRDPNSPDV